MSAVSDRYDSAARLYVRYWEPVLLATAHRLLDRVDPLVRRQIEDARGRWTSAGPARLLDVGTGGGTLALGALRRWPELQVVGIDLSDGMLEVARERALSDRDRLDVDARLTLLRGPADRLPLPDRSVDLIVSSFVYQLVPDRPAAFREALRVLRPGGALSFVTWIDEPDSDFEPTRIVDDLLDEQGVPAPDDRDEEVAGDFVSARAAADQLRRAGFREATADEQRLEYAWSREAFLEYKLYYAEGVGVSELPRDRIDELWRLSMERLGPLDESAFSWGSPVVFASATRPT
jgi:ubiquinone/menaquinone biosynthesis C-methylase UbiE